MADNRNDYTAQKVITSPVAQKVRKAIDSAQKAHLRPALRDGVRGSDNTALSRTFFDRPASSQQRGANRLRWGSGSLPIGGGGAVGAQRRAHGLHTALFRPSQGTDATPSPVGHTGRNKRGRAQAGTGITGVRFHRLTSAGIRLGMDCQWPVPPGISPAIFRPAPGSSPPSFGGGVPVPQGSGDRKTRIHCRLRTPE